MVKNTLRESANLKSPDQVLELQVGVQYAPCHFAGDVKIMKANIHPEYQEVEVICSCGNRFTTRSTYGAESLHIDVCSLCHPFFTGKQKIVDTAGQVDKFRKRYGKKS